MKRDPYSSSNVPMTLTEDQTEFLKGVDRPFRMWDNAHGVCKFIQHGTASYKTALVEYPGGARLLRPIEPGAVEFHPFAFLDPAPERYTNATLAGSTYGWKGGFYGRC